MSQIFRILRKDVRLLWLEIALSLTVLVAYTVWEPGTWATTMPYNVNSQRSVSNVFLFLLFISWALLIVRVVHLERLAGLNQFWTTRPYEWGQLLIAKVAFLQIFIPLPLALAQLVLLHRAHLPVVANLGLVFLNLLKWNGWFVLPLAFVAAVTVSFVQTLIVLLAVLLVYVLDATAGWMIQGRLEPLFLAPLLACLCAVLLCAALVVQYSRRWRWVSAGLAVGGPVLAMLLYAVFGGSSVALAPYGNPSADAQGDPAVVMQFDTNPVRRKEIGSLPDSRTGVRVYVPLSLEPFTGGALNLNGHRVTFTNAQGYTWQTPWLARTAWIAYTGYAGGFIIAGDKPRHFAEAAELPQKVYDRLGDGPVTVRVEFAVEQIQKDPPLLRKLSMVPQEVPGVGVCTQRPNHGAVTCLAAFRTALIRVPSTYPPCGEKTMWQSVYYDSDSLGPVGSPIRRGWMNFSDCEEDNVRFDVFRSRRHILVQAPAVTIALKDYARTNGLER
jgi:hypothetical protein